MYKVSSKIIKKVQKNVFFLRKVTVNLIWSLLLQQKK